MSDLGTATIDSATIGSATSDLATSNLATNQRTADELFEALEQHFELTLEMLSNWGEWLAEHERTIMDSDIGSLQSHLTSAGDLNSAWNELSRQRGQILARARVAGYTCSTLKQLAQGLPQWNMRADFRQRVRNVERCLASLRRLNTAAWLLVNQCSRAVDDTLLLMTSGSTLQSAYIAVPHADTTGGQIFDEQV